MLLYCFLFTPLLYSTDFQEAKIAGGFLTAGGGGGHVSPPPLPTVWFRGQLYSGVNVRACVGHVDKDRDTHTGAGVSGHRGQRTSCGAECCDPSKAR